MNSLAQSDDFKSIVLNQTPLIDVRAAIEFEKGAFINSVNLPLMDNRERHLVGIEYKKRGSESATKLGYKLVSGDIKERRLQAWLEFIKTHPDAMLYCFRGGQRSKISQEWLRDRGEDIARLKGGYKAFRTYLLDSIDNSIESFSPIILGGRTGSGKTILLKKIDNSIDLEALANHRGSSFGRKITPQPTQINFENALSYKLIQKIDTGVKKLVFEDEGKYVGKIYIPKKFASYLSKAPLLILQTPTSKRVEITFNEYITSAQKSYLGAFKDEYLKIWHDDIHDAMKRIARRLGMQRYEKACSIFDAAYNEQKKSSNTDLYREWVTYLLQEYYDPMYDYQIKSNAKQIVFQGDEEEIIEYLQSLT